MVAAGKKLLREVRERAIADELLAMQLRGRLVVLPAQPQGACIAGRARRSNDRRRS